MPRRCAVQSCDNSRGHVQNAVFGFPSTDGEKRKIWTEFLTDINGCLPKANLDNFGLCNLHFLPSDFASNKRLKPNAVPYRKQSFSLCELGDQCQNLNIISDLREKVLALEHQLNEAKQELSRKNVELKNVLERFGPTQTKLLLNPTAKWGHWTALDYMKAISLFSASSKAYNIVRAEMQIPLPSPTSLNRQLSLMEYLPDNPLSSSFTVLKARFATQKMTSLDCQCVISLDEIGIDSKYCYSFSLDRVFGTEKNATVFAARGLFSKWKLPLLYTADAKTSHLQLLIQQLYDIGVNVVAVTSDLGPKNRRMWKDLGIGKVIHGEIQSVSFSHPSTSQPIYWTPDFPHLLKRLRDNMIDASLTLSDGTTIDRSWFKQLLDTQEKNELKLLPKLRKKFLYMKGQARQNVRSAFILFSHTTATAIRTLLSSKPGYKEVADFLELINDLSDILNTRHCKDNSKYTKKPLGIFYEAQLELLQRAKNTIREMKVGTRGNHSFAPFQKGLLMLIESVLGIYSMMQKLPGFEFILTAKLNQDFLENFFSCVRGAGGFKNNPNFVELGYRMRKISLSFTMKYFPSQQHHAFKPENVSQEPDEEDESIATKHDSLLYVDPEIDLPLPFDPQDLTKEDYVLEGSREYVAGYIAFKLSHAHPDLSAEPEEKTRGLWVSSLSLGGLVEPSDIWLATFRKFEEYFQAVHGTSICRDPKIVSKLSDIIRERHPVVPEKVILYYSRVRTFIRINYLNKKIEDEKYGPKQHRYIWESDEESEDILPEASRENEELLDCIEAAFF